MSGRWAGVDPLADESDDLSPYNYVENDPMNIMDPDGMQPVGDISLGESTPYVTGDMGFQELV